MNLIKPEYEIWNPQGYKIEDIYRQVERSGRICYKSEDKITPTSAEPFVQRMIASEHTAMLEHGSVYLEITLPKKAWNKEIVNKYYRNKYSKVTNTYNDYDYIYYVSTNLRVIIENHWESDLRYLCEPGPLHEKRVTVHFTSDIHFYKDTTRHRVFSWAIESTRFCNYIKAKFGSSVSFATPVWLKPEDTEEFEKDLKTIEEIYFKWLGRGWKPEEAAYFLIQGTKAEVVMTGFIEDYKHFFDLRALGTTGKPHPSVKELVEPLRQEFIKLGYINDNV